MTLDAPAGGPTARRARLALPGPGGGDREPLRARSVRPSDRVGSRALLRRSRRRRGRRQSRPRRLLHRRRRCSALGRAVVAIGITRRRSPRRRRAARRDARPRARWSPRWRPPSSRADRAQLPTGDRLPARSGRSGSSDRARIRETHEHRDEQERSADGRRSRSRRHADRHRQPHRQDVRGPDHRRDDPRASTCARSRSTTTTSG